jgi:hypothetical protein
MDLEKLKEKESTSSVKT